MTRDVAGSAIRSIATYFEECTGQRLGESRLWRIEVALRPVLAEHGLPNLDALLLAMRRDPNGPATAATLHRIMNHESSFFRDLNVFHAIETQILPHLNRSLPDRLLRIWCAGCSTGQEVYSLAIILRRQAAMWDGWRISIMGTDVSPFAIDTARAGIYQQMDVQRGLAVTDLLDWFEPVDGNWRVSRALSAMVGFKTDNLIAPQATTGFFDLVLCRNVLMYFAPQSRSAALAAIARFVRPSSLLILGAGETTIGTTSIFAPSSGFRGAYTIAGETARSAMPRRLAG